VAVAEIMEAFAAQAIACIDALALSSRRVNRGGGALARGHPIGASGAILAVRLWHELQRDRTGAVGLAAIAAAGGLGSALVMAG
jgi:acetyl-CoA C-acetyltransferase